LVWLRQPAHGGVQIVTTMHYSVGLEGLLRMLGWALGAEGEVLDDRGEPRAEGPEGRVTGRSAASRQHHASPQRREPPPARAGV
jgi:hypothetical protein